MEVSGAPLVVQEVFGYSNGAAAVKGPMNYGLSEVLKGWRNKKHGM